MRARVLALIAALTVPTAALAQNATEQQMLESAKRMRASAEQLKGRLPEPERLKLIQQAEEMEASVKAGTYAGLGAAPKKASEADRILAERGRLDWLMGEAACAGYTQENYSSFRYSAAINDRDAHCRNAHGHWATYVRRAAADDAEGAEQALFYYDAAAKRAVEHFGRK